MARKSDVCGKYTWYIGTILVIEISVFYLLCHQYRIDTILFKSLGWVKTIEEIKTFIQKGHIKLIKTDSKDIYDVTKDFYFK